MSSNSDFSNTSSKRYALALFELSDESKKLDVIEKELDEKIRIAKEKDSLENIKN